MLAGLLPPCKQNSYPWGCLEEAGCTKWQHWGRDSCAPHVWGGVTVPRRGGRLVRGKAGNCLMRRWWLVSGTCDGVCEGKSTNVVWDGSASCAWPEGFKKLKLSGSKGKSASQQQRGVSGLLSLVLCSLWVYLVNSCPSLFQMVTRTKKIFVGGLSVNTTVEDVKQYFEQFGKVSLLSDVGSKLLLLGQKEFSELLWGRD